MTDKKYNEEDIQNSLKAIDNGMGVRPASKKFKIRRRGKKFMKTGPNP